MRVQPRNPTPETRSPVPLSRCTRNPEPETRNTKHETRNPDAPERFSRVVWDKSIYPTEVDKRVQALNLAPYSLKSWNAFPSWSGRSQPRPSKLTCGYPNPETRHLEPETLKPFPLPRPNLNPTPSGRIPPTNPSHICICKHSTLHPKP
ncbi:hypothetical protein T484DRAFT_3508123 [Baffinella frigidus]|nr:hypothetical protein T484DRAFT_3508123 [Cryptophyta sp. CCMP2293]